MSNTQMALALNVITGSSTKKLILLKLADNASDEGVCWPKIDTIMKHCELSRRAVINNIKELENLGLVEVVERRATNGRQQSNKYKLHLQGAPNALSEGEQGASDTNTGCISCTGEGAPGDTPITLNPHIEPSIEPSNKKLKEKEVLNYLNEKTGKRFKIAPKLSARFKDGFTVEDCKTVIDRKCRQWLNDPKMKKFLRPDTLFSQKFDAYLNEDDDVSEELEIPEGLIPDGSYESFCTSWTKQGDYRSEDLNREFTKAVLELDGIDVLMMSVRAYDDYCNTLNMPQQYRARPEKWLKEKQYNTDWQSERKTMMEREGIIDWSAFKK